MKNFFLVYSRPVRPTNIPDILQSMKRIFFLPSLELATMGAECGTRKKLREITARSIFILMVATKNEVARIRVISRLLCDPSTLFINGRLPWFQFCQLPTGSSQWALTEVETKRNIAIRFNLRPSSKAPYDQLSRPCRVLISYQLEMSVDRKVLQHLQIADSPIRLLALTRPSDIQSRCCLVTL